MTHPALLNLFLLSSLAFFAILLLYFAKALLIPFVMAIVIWYVILTLKMSVQQIPFIGNKIPRSLAMSVALLLVCVLLYAIYTIINSNIVSLIQLAPDYGARLHLIKDQMLSYFDIKAPLSLNQTWEHYDFMSIFTTIAQSVAEIARNILLIAIYVIFLIFENRYFDKKINSIAKNQGKEKAVREILDKISTQVQMYIKIKTFVSFATALCSWIVMKFMHLDFAEFWALLIFLLNYIPAIGSIVATIFPLLIALVQFDSLLPVMILALLLIAIQAIFSNIIEPRMMGRSFNLSPLVILLSLAVWGYIWGLVGMILSVPIMVILNIIFTNFKETENIAILLSEKGEVK